MPKLSRVLARVVPQRGTTLGNGFGASAAASSGERRDAEAARLVLIRRRIQLLAIAIGGSVSALALLAWWVRVGLLDRPLRSPELLSILANIVLGVVIALAPRLRRDRINTASVDMLVRRATLVIIAALVGQFVVAEIFAHVLSAGLQRMGFTTTVGPALPLVALFMAMHSTASIILPWRLGEAIRPCLAVVALQLLSVIGSSDDLTGRVIGLTATVSACVPGLAITAIRQRDIAEWISLYINDSRYQDLRKELTFARRVHERLFPPPLDAPTILRHRYTPTADLGGDVVSTWIDRDGCLNLALLDVSGHGIAASLAVNRLTGEIKRLHASGDSDDPARIAAGLNEYINLTLADEQLFATGVVAHIDHRTRTVSLTNAGHPPVLLLRRDGRIEQIGSDATILGALSASEFESMPQRVTLEPGDRLFLFTDGAFECRNIDGVMLELEGFITVVASALAGRGDLDSLLESIDSRLAEYTGTAPQDDMLLVGLEIPA